MYGVDVQLSLLLCAVFFLILFRFYCLQVGILIDIDKYLNGNGIYLLSTMRFTLLFAIQ